MARQHPVHDVVAALTRVQRQRIEVTPTVSYRVEAPCLLQQLAEAVGLGTETGGRGVPGSRANVALDALDLWTEIHTSTTAWAELLGIDRAPYRQSPPEPAPARGRPNRQRPLPWLQQLHLADDTPAEVLTQIGQRVDDLSIADLDYTQRPARQLVPDPDRLHQLPPAGRLLRALAGAATSAGLTEVADAIHRSADRWRRQIEQMLHGVTEQRGIRGACCPDPGCGALCITHLHPPASCAEEGCCERCSPGVIVEPGPDGQHVIRPTIVLTQRDLAGEALSWLSCLACGWSRSLADPAGLAEVAS